MRWKGGVGQDRKVRGEKRRRMEIEKVKITLGDDER